MVTIHPRTLIRHAVVAVLKKSPAVTAICGQRIFPNRNDPWDEEELPAMGVYQLAEDPLETDKSPAPDERRLTLSFETLAKCNEGLEDLMDAVSLALEQALDLDTIGAVLGEHDTLMELRCGGCEVGLAAEGKRLVGVGIDNFTLDYGMPPNVPAFKELPDYLQSFAGWDLAGSDPRVIDAEDIVQMPGWDEEE